LCHARNRILCALWIVALAATGAGAQEPPDDVAEFDGLNFSFASVAGSGIYTVNGRTAWIIRVPISFPLWSADEKPWGLRIVAPITFGFYDLEPRDLVVEGIPDHLATISPVIGVELSHKLTDNWTLYPFGFAGPAVELSTKERGWLMALGVRSRAEFPWKDRAFVLWNRLVYARDFQNNRLDNDDFVQFETDLEFRYPVTARTAVGMIVANELYFNRLIINRPDESFAVTRRWEVAVSYGPMRGDVKVWKFKLPRVSLGYRFGQDITGFKLGFRYKY